MLRNYLVTVFRQIRNHKSYSLINLLGLASGMAACLIIAQYVHFHTGFDEYHPKADQTYRIAAIVSQQNNPATERIQVPYNLGEALHQNYPEVIRLAQFYDYGYGNSTIQFTQADKVVSEEQSGIYFASASAFELFELPFVAGKPYAPGEPGKAVMTMEAVSRFVANPQDAIGSVFTLESNNGNQQFELVGVIEELPAQTHLNFELLLSLPSVEPYSPDYKTWEYGNMITYFQLNDHNDAQAVLQAISSIHENNSKALMADSGYTLEYFLQPLTDIHVISKSGFDFSQAVDQRTLYALSIIAVIILLIAWINYLNLSMARTLQRLREIGIRKCMGSSLPQLMSLFLLEALVMNALAFALALTALRLGDQWIVSLTGLAPKFLFSTPAILVLSALILVGTLLIGFYPYLVLKTLKTSQVLLGKKQQVGGLPLRKTLVFVQFAITFLLIAGTLTVYFQVNYMRKADLGIAIDNTLVIQSPPVDVMNEDRSEMQRFTTFKNALMQQPYVAAITTGGELPGEPISWAANLRLKNESQEKSIQTGLISMGLNFPEFFQLELIAGRQLRKGDNPWSRGDVVINRRLAESLGFSDPVEAIGAELDGFYGPGLQVRGVVENHHHTSLHNDFTPIAYILSSWTEYYFVKLQAPQGQYPGSVALDEQIADIEAAWDNIYTQYPMDYFFLDRAFDAQYREDVRFGNIFSGFSVLAILIAGLGLFGLTSFTVQQRTKEIGIRKVLGASLQNLLLLLSKDYLLLVGIAGVASLPVGWYLMSQWLTNYSFRIELGWWFIAVPLVVVLLIAMLSIMGKVVQTAQANPVHSLRSE